MHRWHRRPFRDVDYALACCAPGPGASLEVGRCWYTRASHSPGKVILPEDQSSPTGRAHCLSSPPFPFLIQKLITSDTSRGDGERRPRVYNCPGLSPSIPLASFYHDQTVIGFLQGFVVHLHLSAEDPSGGYTSPPVSSAPPMWISQQGADLRFIDRWHIRARGAGIWNARHLLSVSQDYQLLCGPRLISRQLVAISWKSLFVNILCYHDVAPDQDHPVYQYLSYPRSRQRKLPSRTTSKKASCPPSIGYWYWRTCEIALRFSTYDLVVRITQE